MALEQERLELLENLTMRRELRDLEQEKLTFHNNGIRFTRQSEIDELKQMIKSNHTTLVARVRSRP